MATAELKIPTVLHPIPHFAPLLDIMTRRRGESRAVEFMACVQEIYDNLYEWRPVYRNRYLRQHVEDNILVGLAVYRACQVDGLSPADALAETRAVLAELADRTGINTRAVRWLTRLVPEALQYRVMRPVIRWMMHHVFPPEGWDVQWLEDSPRRMAFLLTRCLYLNVLQDYGSPELTQAFCDHDDRLADMLRPAILFERHGTLGRGQAACDFCYHNRRAYSA